MEKNTKNLKVTFPEVPVSYDCNPDGFIELVSLYRCGNMDAYELNITHKGKPLSLYFSGIFVAKVVEALGYLPEA